MRNNISKTLIITIIPVFLISLTSTKFSKRINEYIGSSEPHDWNFHIIKGNKKLKDGEYTKAISSYNKIINQDNSNSLAFLGRGMANVELGNFSEAIKDYKMAIKLEPKNSYFYIKRGVAYRKIKNYEMALKDFTLAIELEGLNKLKKFKDEYSFYYANSSIAKEKVGDFSGAYFDLKRAYFDAIK